MYAECPACDYKINIPKAQDSVYHLGQVVYAHCTQAARIVYNIAGVHSSNVVDYATIWRLALFNYNAGPICVYDAVKAAYEIEDRQGRLTWEQIAAQVTGGECELGLDYVAKITNNL